MKKTVRKGTVTVNIADDIKGRLGVLWVLLNVSTEYKHDSSKVCRLMDAIEKFEPTAREAWDKDIMIHLDHKKVFHRETGHKAF